MQSHYNGNSWWGNDEPGNYLKNQYGISDPQVEEFDYKVMEEQEDSYTAENSLFSVKEDYKIGNGTDPNDQIVATGLHSHVYPDRETAYNIAKSYGMKDDDIENYTDTHLTQGASNTTSEGEVIAADNFVYRIEKDAQYADWTMYGYLDGEDFVLVDEETFNNDSEGEYEETTAYYFPFPLG
jgi:hypothetical protein